MRHRSHASVELDMFSGGTATLRSVGSRLVSFVFNMFTLFFKHSDPFFQNASWYFSSLPCTPLLWLNLFLCAPSGMCFKRINGERDADAVRY